MTETRLILGGTLRIPKSSLTRFELDCIRADLTHVPSGGGSYGFGDHPTCTLTYSEVGDWIDVPRAYGLRAMRKFNSLKLAEIVDRTSPGSPAEFTFNNDMQNQRPERKKIQDKMVGDVVRKFGLGVTNGILNAPCGCHAAGELVLMANGSSKAVENVAVGDLLMGSGGYRRVLELHRGRQQMVRVTPNKGAPFTVNLGHILTVMWSVSDGARRDGELIDIPISEWILSSKNFRRHTVLYREKVDNFITFYTDLSRPIHPYHLGVLLGDGTLKYSPGVTKNDPQIETTCREIADGYGLSVRKDNWGGRCPTWRITTGRNTGRPKTGPNGLINDLRQLGLWGTTARGKFVPDQYKYGPVGVRRQILAGLIDTDGYLTCGCYEFSSASFRLAEDVLFISRSIGLAAYIRKTRSGYWKVMISGDCASIPVRIPRKQCAPRRINKDAQRVGIRSTEVLPEADYYGFVVDGDRRYLMGDFTLTHNTGKTVCGLKVAAEMGRTTLVLVYKDFLVTQWRERISQWLGIPGDEVGIVQQNRCEYLGRKIVIAMIQSVVERDYDPGFYSWAGLLIGDEIHRHGADLWNKSSIRFTSKYRLGLTATPVRKDGLWAVVSGNFGDIIAADSCEAMRPTIYVVRYRPHLVARRYCYVSMSPMGTPKIKKVYLGKLTTLLSQDPDRNKIILDIIMKAAREGRQVLLLTDRRPHIELLKKEVIERSNGTVTVGRYVGGMSESARAISEKCQVILGTFQMAQEALDIPTLDVGILATPHSDVEQPIGRICRQLDGKKSPVIIDIADDEPYICQHLERKRLTLYAQKEWPVKTL